ncbi:MAG: hypothetical protein RMK19_05595 [Bacteroidia bacterium]|nr:hypothetical protein [Bacteroidia bacterium]MDW8015468.1 hypothetical protein [Bacteroidia bacterium]
MHKWGLPLLFLWGCALEEAEIPLWYAVEVTGETVPLIPFDCRIENPIKVAKLILRRDPLTNGLEWVSGHRYALGFFLEQLPIEVVVLEPEWHDTAFFTSSTLSWNMILQEWLINEFIPFIRPYPQVKVVIFGRGWVQAPLSSSDWERLLSTLRQYQRDSQLDSLSWGFCAGTPEAIPAASEWDIFAIDYQHFFPPHTRPDYHAQWEAGGKPLLLLYPNLYEPNPLEARQVRRLFWKTPPIAQVEEIEIGQCN